jgi:hypothetical protein
MHDISCRQVHDTFVRVSKGCYPGEGNKTNVDAQEKYDVKNRKVMMLIKLGKE